MRIDRDGVWFYHGTPIVRKELVRLFASVLQRDAAGRYWLVTPAERGRIEVADAPLLAVALEVEGGGREQALTLLTNVDGRAAVGAEHPLRVDRRPATGEPRPYVAVGPGIEARLTPAVFYALADLAVAEPAAGEGVLGVWSRGAFFALGRADGD